MNLNVLKDIFDNPKDERLACYIPGDTKHLEKYSLTSVNAHIVMPTKPVCVQIGIPWHRSFYDPVLGSDGIYRIGLNKDNLGPIEGGHSLCLLHKPTWFLDAWHKFYNQLFDGKCVGEAGSIMCSMHNRIRYNTDYLWNKAKELDEFDDTNPGDNNGTTVRAGFDVLRTIGHSVQIGNRVYAPQLVNGISANYWATTGDQILQALGNPTYIQTGEIIFTNSWGEDYPKYVRIPVETLQYFLEKEWAEYGIPTDR